MSCANEMQCVVCIQLALATLHAVNTVGRYELESI